VFAFDQNISFTPLPPTLECLDIIFKDSLYPKQLFELKKLISLTINNEFSLTEDFLSLSSLKFIEINRITIKDVNILSQMPNLDTLFWNNDKPNSINTDFIDIVKSIPVEIKCLKIKNLIISGFDGWISPDGIGHGNIMAIAVYIKKRLPNTKVNFLVNGLSVEVLESDLKQKYFWDCPKLDE
jgi:hypothetical protein